MSLDIVWFVIVAFFWAGFFVLEGFDFGVGVLHHFVGRTDDERRLAMNSVGPLWDGNEVWLIVAGAGTFAAFPDWYATWFSAGYLALMALLVALIIRGVSFEWRGKLDTNRWRGTWSWTLVIGSVLTPVLLGTALGDLLVGLPIDPSWEYTGNFWNLLTPFGLFTGLTALILCLGHGATFLSLKTGDPVRSRARHLALPLTAVGLVAVLVYSVWTVALGGGGAWRVLAAAIPVVGSIVAVVALRRGAEGWSFVGTAVSLGGMMVALFANLYPYVMVSSTNAANNLTVSGAASANYTLKVMTIVALVLTPVVLVYQGWSYHVFRVRLHLPERAEEAERETSRS